MSDTLDTALFILALIALWSMCLLFIRGKLSLFISVLFVAIIFFIMLSFYDRQEGTKVNEDKLAETKDKWQDSEVLDR